MLRGDLELLDLGISEWLGLSDEKSYEAEAAVSILTECLILWHKVLISKLRGNSRSDIMGD